MLKQMIFGIVLHKQQGMSNRRYTVLQKSWTDNVSRCVIVFCCVHVSIFETVSVKVVWENLFFFMINGCHWIIISLFQNEVCCLFDVNEWVTVTYFSLDLISGNWCETNDDHMDQSDGVSCCYSGKRFHEPRLHSCAASSFPHPSWPTAWLKGYVSSWYYSDDLFVSSQKH